MLTNWHVEEVRSEVELESGCGDAFIFIEIVFLNSRN